MRKPSVVIDLDTIIYKYDIIGIPFLHYLPKNIPEHINYFHLP